MRTFIFSLILIGFSRLIPSEACAQSFPQPYRNSTAAIAERYPHVIKLNPLSPFVLTANGAYEHFINAKLSLQLGAFYNGITLEENDFLGFNLPSARYRSFAITPELRFYTGSLTRAKLDGFYLGPFLRYQNTDVRISADLQQNNNQGDGRTFEANLSTVRIGAIAGYKFVLGERISLEAFAGPSIRVVKSFNSNINTYNAEDFISLGLPIRSGILIGFLF